MATYWASKPFIPSRANISERDESYKALLSLKEALAGLTVSQGQVIIGGAADMLGALQYHYQNFLGIVNKKAQGKLDVDVPDERYEAVAYLGRLGQFYYFAKSKFVEELIPNAIEMVPDVHRLVPFRMKYVAHRAMDKPLNEEEAKDSNHELALGAMGGKLFQTRVKRDLETQSAEWDKNLDDHKKWLYKDSYVLFEMYFSGCRTEFNMELDHVRVMQEAADLMQTLVGRAKLLPRE